MELSAILLLLLLPIAVYVLSRMASSAYFRSKHDYIKRVTNHADTPSKPDKQ